MPQNGEINIKFGVYKTVCCGEEIVITEGMSFPDCPNHLRLTTVWRPVVTDTIIRLSAAGDKSGPAT